ncbi:MAG: hypothetical protein HY819_22120 [Acidobacteria bacterium]|nr:hypothetical protein [Acidobacteriota bacterium]
MNKLILSLFILVLFTINLAAQTLGGSGMRVMPVDELSLRADVIVRAKVKKVEKASYLDYTQLATLHITDIIKGDSRLKEVRVWSGTQNINANDSFSKDNDVIIFLVHEQTFYRLLNFQFGIFPIEGETVRNWRFAIPPNPNPNETNNNAEPIENTPFGLIDKGYTEVRKEIAVTLRSVKGGGKGLIKE